VNLDRVCVRAYNPIDRDACLGVFDSNVPDSFTLPERPEFQTFLDDLPGPYLVLEVDGSIVACGGYARADGREASMCADLCWGMVARGAQGSGLGRLLTEARLSHIRRDPTFTEVALRTSQLTRGFYELMGFVIERLTPDGIAPGLDKCEMRLQIGITRFTDDR
jgi:hypothetical protein